MKIKEMSFLFSDFGSKIRRLREEKGLSRYEFYDAVYKISDSTAVDESTKRKTVSAWESGKHMPQAQILPRIADVLGCDIDFLYDRIKDKTRTIEFIHNELGMQSSFIEKLIKAKNSPPQNISYHPNLLQEVDYVDNMLVLLECIYSNYELMEVLYQYLSSRDVESVELETSELTRTGIPVPNYLPSKINLPMDSLYLSTLNDRHLDASLVRQSLIHKIQNVLDNMDADIPHESLNIRYIAPY